MGSLSRNQSLEDIICARCGDLMDISVVSCGQSDTASLWVRYLSSCFQQIAKEQNRPPFKLLNLCVEDILSGLSSIPEQERCAKSRLQVWVLCPKFLARLQDCHQGHELGTIMRPVNVLALLLGVSEETISNQHRTTLYNYDHWKRLTVKDQDPTFVGDVLGISMDILSRSWQNQADSEKAHFSIIPKKIKVGQNKLIILMNEPLEAEDHIRVSVDKNGHRIEVQGVKRRNPYTLQFVMPAACLQISILATVYVEKNGESMGHKLVKCESRMRELDQLLKTAENPLHFLCQTLGVSPGDREQLDTVLVAALHKNMPPHFNLLQPNGLRHHSSSEEFPTLLHFAAKFGLEKLSWSLLECPGGEQASHLRNGAHLTPSDIAEKAGHHKLADALKGHLQMTELSSMYTYLKGISNQQGFNDSNYLIPRPLHESYSVPPPARPVLSPLTPPTPSSPFYTNLPSYQIPPSPVKVSASADFPYQNSLTFSLPSYMDNYKIPAGGLARAFSPSASPTEKEPPHHLTPFGAYLEMQASQNFGVSSANHLRPNLKLDPHHHEDRNGIKFSSFGKKSDDVTSPCSLHSDSLSHSSSSTFSHFHLPSPSIKSTSTVQDELIEIINDFKHNVLSIAEVEKLVDNWRSRNDVQQSFIEKKAQLEEMRKEYDRIQQSLKDHLKRPTPLERIRKFFTRSKSKNSSEHGHKGASSDNLSASTRPISSLSLHSSSSTSSTGRISTGSATSVGDSGTHSDHDDRKQTEQIKFSHPLSHATNNHHFYSDIPFIPKPLHPHPLTPLTHTLSMDEYKHSEKRALCTSCHDYTNVRAPLLRGNSYQEEAIVEEEHGNENEATNEVVVEVHSSSTSSSNNSENQSNSSQTFVNMDNEIRCNTDNREKCGCESENIDSNIHQVNIELSEEVGRIVSENKTVDNDLKQTNEEVQKKQDIQLTCNGKNRDAFIIETQTKENFGIVHKGDESDITQNNQGNSTEGMDHLITDVNKEFKPKDVETKGKNVHELTHMFEHVEDLLKTKHNNDEDGSNESRGSSKDQEDLDNSFEREFKDSCKEIINSARNSIAKEFQLNKDLDTLKSFNSESTLQLSDVETENCQYDASSYVNINTCRTTNL